MDDLATLAGVLGLAVLVYILGRLSGMRTSEQIHCQEKDSDFVVQFERQLGPMWGPGKKLNVVRCTAFADPSQVTCAKRCLG